MRSKVDNFLAHYGIKGMKWGVRRSDGPGGTVSSALGKGAKKVGKKLVQPAAVPGTKEAHSSPDAVRAQAAVKTIKRAGGTHALSNQDLNHLVNRLNLEKKLAELDTGKIGKTNKGVKRALGYGGTMNDAIRFANSDAGLLLSRTLNLTKTAGKHVKT